MWRSFVEAAQYARTGWGLLAGDDVSMVLNNQLTVQHLDHLHERPCIARSLNARQ